MNCENVSKIEVGKTYKVYELEDEDCYEEVVICGIRTETTDNNSLRYLTFNYHDGVNIGEARISTDVPETDLVYDYFGNYPYGNEDIFGIVLEMGYSEEDIGRVLVEIEKNKRKQRKI